MCGRKRELAHVCGTHAHNPENTFAGFDPFFLKKGFHEVDNEFIRISDIKKVRERKGLLGY